MHAPNPPKSVWKWLVLSISVGVLVGVFCILWVGHRLPFGAPIGDLFLLVRGILSGFFAFVAMVWISCALMNRGKKTWFLWAFLASLFFAAASFSFFMVSVSGPVH
jgi:hypothetical protein